MATTMPATASSYPSGRYSFPSSPVARPTSLVTGGKGSKYRFTVLSEKLVRYEWSEDGTFEDRASTLAIFRDFGTPRFAVFDDDDQVSLSTRFFTLTYKKTTGTFENGGLSVRVGDDTWVYNGESYGDLNGTARTLDGANGRIPLDPGVLSRHKPFSVIDDSKSMLFDENGWIATREDGRKDGYVFALGHPREDINAFYALSGRQPLLPRWALGNWWSRYHEYSADEYSQVMKRFEEEKIPLTVAVLDMDWHKVNIPPEYGSGWTGYSWNTELFPNPDVFLTWLRDSGLKVTVNDHPADGIRAFEDQYEEVAGVLNHDTSEKAPIEFDCTNRDFLDAFFDVLKKNLESQGIDFWWVDWQQGTKSKLPGVDPLWVLNHYHYLTSKRNIPRLDKPLTFSRYAGPGSHRYPIGFSGDTFITWESLNFQPEFTATASNIGYGWWSHDIGGHMSGVRSNEMMVRWVQLGCFSPILRLHSSKTKWLSKEPWLFEPEAGKAIKEALIFRHRLIPYLFTMNIRAHYENAPLIQPMYWHHHEREEAYSVPNQYYFGPDLIVAPITTPIDKTTLSGSVRAWLPRTFWDSRYIDIFKPSMVYDVDRYVTLHRTLEQIPVLAPEGTIVHIEMKQDINQDDPTNHTPFKHGVSEYPDIHIKLVVGSDASIKVYEEPSDDQRQIIDPPIWSFIYTIIHWNQKSGTLTIGPEMNGSGKSRKWVVELVGVTGGEVEQRARDAGFRVVGKGGDIHHGNSTHIFLGSIEPSEGVVVELGRDLQLDVVDIRGVLEEMLYRCEMEYEAKDTIFNIVTDGDGSGKGVEERVRRLMGLDVPGEVKSAVMEIWTADSRSVGGAWGLGDREGHVGRGDAGGGDGDWGDIHVKSVDGEDVVLVSRVGEGGL